MTRLAIGSINFYRRHRRSVFFFLPYGTCRFEPSCSTYALRAYERFGWFWGSALTAWRIFRCNPWSPGGADPVPEWRTGAGTFNRRDKSGN
jgi:putative membrane protein insertion efficiency factor